MDALARQRMDRPPAPAISGPEAPYLRHDVVERKAMLQLKTDKILAQVENGIGWITFNNPERRNAMSLEMWSALGDALEAFQSDPAVRVVVMKGAGGKAFVSGADISQFDKGRPKAEQRAESARLSAGGRDWLGRFDKPLIAMIQGFCIGGGLGI